MSVVPVSLICTVKNDHGGLVLFWRSFEQLTVFPTELCITVDTSSDGTLELVQSWRHPHTKIHVVATHGLNRSQGRNHAVQLSTQPFLAFTDAGCSMDPDWLRCLYQAMKENPKIPGVAGLTLGKAHNFWEEVQVPYVLVAPHQVPKNPLPATRNMMVKRTVWDAVGEFEPTLQWAEDYEWARRASKKGFNFTYVPEAIVYWRPRATPLLFFWMIERLTFGDMRAKTWRRGHVTMWLRYIFLFVLSVLAALLVGWPQSRLIILGLWLLYCAIKASYFQFSHWQTYLLVPVAQALADAAVLIGTVHGILSGMTQKDVNA